MKKESYTYSYVEKDFTKWPIYSLSQDKEQFIKEVNAFTLNRILEMHKTNLSEEVAKVIYLERIRIKENPWKVDPAHEGSFWGKLRRKLTKHSLDKEGEEVLKNDKEILSDIINRYSTEIAGNFSIPTYRFARGFLSRFFNRLLNTAASRNLKRLYGARYQLKDRLKIRGEIETIRSLSEKGTVVVVPTHYSNLDSILIGWGIDSIGLPALSYGAGLNLFNSGILAFFMNRLGAYKVDRRKKNMVYLETLKAFSKLSIERGTHSLFFPGGTRERSGMIEKKLKMGLLGTVTEAQRSLFEKEKEEKIFIVPLVLGYNFVLEAQPLITSYLQRTGKELFIPGKRELTFFKVVRFLWKLFSDSSEIQLSFGKPIDVMGNFVNENGESLDKHGAIVDLKSYFMTDGKITSNLQREMEYTKRLSTIIVDRFHKENIVLSSHVVAYAAFNILRSRHPSLDLFGLLRIPSEEREITYREFRAVVDNLRQVLLKFADNELLKLSTKVKGDIKELILDGIQNLGAYHPNEPLGFNNDKNIICEEMKLLFYYHNKLEGYGLAKMVNWKAQKLEENVLTPALNN